MKYKLIEEYPGSPTLGTEILHFKTNKNLYYTNCIDTFVLENPENYPKFWEKVIEKDYEILFINHSGNILPYDKCQNILKHYWSIHSVKRLSDGEIFTIGDKIHGHKLEQIFIAFSNKNDLILSCEGLKRALYLIEDKHLKIDSKQPLFTTEDGVDKYLGDSFAYINPNFPDKVIEDSVRNLNYQKYVKHFSTKEAAEEYILMNKPCLSLNDVATIYKGLNKKTNHPSSQANQLKQLVRNKIRQSV